MRKPHHPDRSVDSVQDTVQAPETAALPHVEHKRAAVHRKAERVIKGKPLPELKNATPAAQVHPEQSDTYSHNGPETKEQFLTRRRAEEKELSVKTPQELIEAMESDPYLQSSFYKTVLAMPANQIPAARSDQRGSMLSRAGGWLRRQLRDIGDDMRHRTNFVKPNDWMERKAEVAKRILASPGVQSKEHLYGEHVIQSATHLRKEFELAA